MKYILILTITLFGLNTVSAQNVIDKHFSYLLEEEDATNINVTGKMFEMLNNIDVDVDSEDEEELVEMQEFLGSIRSFQLVAAAPSSTRKRFDSGNAKLSGDYEELVSVKDKKGRFMLYIDEQNGTVHEVVGIGTDNEKMVVFSLLGAMKLEHVGKVAEHIQDAGISQLSTVSDYNISEVKVYPNPVSSGGVLNLETAEAFDKGVATLLDSNGAVVKTYKINNATQSLQIENLAAGNYVLKITKDAVSVKKNVLVVN